MKMLASFVCLISCRPPSDKNITTITVTTHRFNFSYSIRQSILIISIINSLIMQLAKTP